uniref:Ig-like domain-containing protein n=1 Tax=Strigamia maritima TaxID=126957 RepID=T1JIS8_STRMM
MPIYGHSVLVNQNAETIDLYGPRFVREPLSVIDFSNSTGISIDCLAKGNPSPVIEWIRPDGAVVGNVQGLRYVLSNGTIYFPPFRAEEYRQDVHASIYACAASNPFGRIISREVTLRA